MSHTPPAAFAVEPASSPPPLPPCRTRTFGKGFSWGTTTAVLGKPNCTQGTYVHRKVCGWGGGGGGKRAGRRRSRWVGGAGGRRAENLSATRLPGLARPPVRQRRQWPLFDSKSPFVVAGSGAFSVFFCQSHARPSRFVTRPTPEAPHLASEDRAAVAAGRPPDVGSSPLPAGVEAGGDGAASAWSARAPARATRARRPGSLRSRGEVERDGAWWGHPPSPGGCLAGGKWEGAVF